jgi:hypothetical protein
MAIKRTRWTPDTCGCVLEYEWDDALPVDARVHRAVDAVPCAIHASIHQARAARAGEAHRHLHATVVEENRRKNQTLAALAEAGHDVAGLGWHFDQTRTLRIAGATGATLRLAGVAFD